MTPTNPNCPLFLFITVNFIQIIPSIIHPNTNSLNPLALIIPAQQTIPRPTAQKHPRLLERTRTTKPCDRNVREGREFRAFKFDVCYVSSVADEAETGECCVAKGEEDVSFWVWEGERDCSFEAKTELGTVSHR